ncbi:SAV_915 family protein [Nocardiopsis rhodophaea]|uniref:SAV_915 family protein n=1 Tax=Nocardiopsis rhodophaea TaxID=280238 RepID=UPI0031DF09FB
MCVPVRVTNGVECVRLARLGSGERVALEFSSPERLRAAMGPRQRWIRMAEPALRSLVRPLGVTRIQSDPNVVATPARTPRTRTVVRPMNQRAVGAATRHTRRG